MQGVLVKTKSLAINMPWMCSKKHHPKRVSSINLWFCEKNVL